MSIMIYLKNIKISDTAAEADYSPESSGWWGHIVVDLTNQDIAKVDRHPDYGTSYAGHAFWKLLSMAENHDNTKECTVMWY